MAEIEISYKIVERLEGGYVNDPVDRGGETVYGISRKSHPDWEGWHFLDNPVVLRSLAKRLYRRLYWLPIQGHQYPSQRLGNIVLQAAVHCGVRTASRWLQRSLNEIHPLPLKVDGRVGNHTLYALYDCLNAGRLGEVEDNVLAHQKRHYEVLVDRDATQEKFLRGWMNRLKGL